MFGSNTQRGNDFRLLVRHHAGRIDRSTFRQADCLLRYMAVDVDAERAFAGRQVDGGAEIDAVGPDFRQCVIVAVDVQDKLNAGRIRFVGNVDHGLHLNSDTETASLLRENSRQRYGMATGRDSPIAAVRDEAGTCSARTSRAGL